MSRGVLRNFIGLRLVRVIDGVGFPPWRPARPWRKEGEGRVSARWVPRVSKREAGVQLSAEERRGGTYAAVRELGRGEKSGPSEVRWDTGEVGRGFGWAAAGFLFPLFFSFCLSFLFCFPKAFSKKRNNSKQKKRIHKTTQHRI